jgi:argininosuccinate synthase
VQAVEVQSPHLMRDADAVYAQRASWTGVEAAGFIKLFGQSSRLWSRVNEAISRGNSDLSGTDGRSESADDER